jgi:SAM-dependent MidA family methyltransferase
LAADILRAARRDDPALYDRIKLHLVEASDRARAAQALVLDDVADRLASSGPTLPESFEGVLIANELFDAMPVHQVVMREDGLHEVYVTHTSGGRTTDGPTTDTLATTVGPLSTPALSDYVERAGIRLEPGWRGEINLRGVEWIRDAARRLRRGFMILIDYGHEAAELYSATHSAGTLTSFARHRSAGPEAAGTEWLRTPGEQDITSHVDFTSIRAAAEAEGMETIALLDQTYFLMGLFEPIRQSISNQQSTINNLKTLIMPGGLGSSHKVLLLGKGVGRPPLQGCAFKVRVT